MANPIDEAVAAMRQGRFAEAFATAQRRLAAAPRDPAALAIAGDAASQLGELDAALDLRRRLLALDPRNPQARGLLASSLAAAGRHAEAQDAIGDYRGFPRLARIAGDLLVHLQRDAVAIRAYEETVRINPADYQAWHNLGTAQRRAGNLPKALAALRKACATAPQSDKLRPILALSSALQVAGETPERLSLLSQAAQGFPNEGAVHLELGLAALVGGHVELAETALRRATELEQVPGPAMLELGFLFSSTNRVAELEALIAGPVEHQESAAILLLRAQLHYRQGNAVAAAEILDRLPAGLAPHLQAQIRAECAEKQGDAEQAYLHYVRMNAATTAHLPPDATDTYRDFVEKNTREMLPPPGPAIPFDRASPVFVLGSPRSGTTLLDVMLGAHPDVVVAEERPMREAIRLRYPGFAQESDRAVIEDARAFYFDWVERELGPLDGRLLVDKHPLHMAEIPIINRLFPDARIVLVERHPCDAVFSCFKTAFIDNVAMRSFTTLESAARTYDALFANWTRALELFDIGLHTVRYERMVTDLEAELRPLVEFIGLEWRDALLDNQSAAQDRKVILTASHAQVLQPLNAAALGRWKFYERQLEPVMPLLLPWIKRMGYEA